MPTEAEVIEHAKHHLSYRSWCRHCIRGRGREAPHVRGGEDPNIPEIHLDYMFMGEEGVSDKLTVLVVRERLSKMTLATVVASKTTGEFAATRVVAFMREIGCDQVRITVKTDNEPALVALVSEIGRARASNGAQPMNIETSPVYASASNGVIERSVQSVQGMARD